MLQTVTNHLPVMVTHSMPFQRSHDLRNLALRPVLGKLRDLCRLRLALQQRLQHQLTGHSENV